MRLPLLAVTLATAALLASCSGGSGTGAAPASTALGTTAPAAPATPSAAPSAPASPAATATATGGPVDPLSPRPGLESAAPLGQPPCRGSALTVTDADMVVTPQYRREVFVVRTSGPACQLSGYPKVTLVGADGRALPVRTQAGGFGLPAERPAPVTLSRTTSLSFAVATSRDGSCVDVSAVLATLPGTSTAHRAPTELRVCGAVVGLSPVHRQGDQE